MIPNDFQRFRNVKRDSILMEIPTTESIQIFVYFGENDEEENIFELDIQETKSQHDLLIQQKNSLYLIVSTKDISLPVNIKILQDSIEESIDSTNSKEASTAGNTDIPRKRNLFFDNETPDLISILRKWTAGKFFINFDYQREYIWDSTKASRLIESLLLKIPIPSIYCSEGEDGKYEIIDGQQRITSIVRFLENKFRLKNLESLPVLNGLNYNDMQKKFSDAAGLIEDSTIPFIKITKESDPDIKFDVFMRINQGSTDLNEQELRNCLYRGDLTNKLKAVRKNSTIQKIMNTSGDGHIRYQDMALLLRILAIYEAFDHTELQLFDPMSQQEPYKIYKGNIKSHLNMYMEKYKHLEINKSEEKVDKLLEMLEVVYHIFKEKSFRRPDRTSRSINSALMDVICVSFMFYIENGQKDILIKKRKEIEKLLNTLCKNSGFIETITLGTSGIKTMNTRFKYWFDGLAPILE